MTKYGWLIDRHERDGRVTVVGSEPHTSYEAALFSCRVLRGMSGLRYKPRKVTLAFHAEPPERDEDIDTNESGDLSPEDERLAEGLRY